MKKSITLIIIVFISYVFAAEFTPEISAKQQLNLAKELNHHGYADDALKLLIGIYNNKSTSKKIKAEALYLMGEISYDKKDFHTAIDDWMIFTKDFPKHRLYEEILDKLANIKDAVFKYERAKVTAIDMANDYYRHNFKEKAKEKFLEIYHDPLTEIKEKAQALYIVGQIIFEEGNYTLALEDWEILISKFPDSEYAKEITKRLSQITDIITYDSQGNTINILAQAYLQNGDFWSNAERKFVIDSSWMPSVENALIWYNKILEEFPNTLSAEVAYRRKLFTLIGITDTKDEDKMNGLQKDFNKYMPQVLKTFTKYERDFPESQYLQGFRYQIAQAYWIRKEWTNARKWLMKIIAAGEGEETFYTETAKARLKKLEY